MRLAPFALLLSGAAFVAGAALPQTQNSNLVSWEDDLPFDYCPSPPGVPREQDRLPKEVKERLGIPFYKDCKKPTGLIEWIKKHLPREEDKDEAGGEDDVPAWIEAWARLGIPSEGLAFVGDPTGPSSDSL